eukprot:449388_1
MASQGHITGSRVYVCKSFIGSIQRTARTHAIFMRRNDVKRYDPRCTSKLSYRNDGTKTNTNLSFNQPSTTQTAKAHGSSTPIHMVSKSFTKSDATFTNRSSWILVGHKAKTHHTL